MQKKATPHRGWRLFGASFFRARLKADKNAFFVFGF